MKIIEELNNYKNQATALILRHADRDKIPDGEFGNDVLLNSKGVERSIEFGKKLKKYNIVRIYTSPIQRCVQTGKYISEGYGLEIEIIETTALGNPGLHITDDREAGEYFLKHGFHYILDEFITGKIPPGMPSQKELRMKMDSFVRESSGNEGLTLYITHDSMIAMYDYVLSGRIYTKDNWVPYLSGILKPIL